MKHSQITIFIILGMLFVVSVSLSLNAREERIASEYSEKADTVVQEIIESDMIQKYVSMCLDKLTTEGLYLLENQGGVIYDNQGGILPISKFIQLRIGDNYSANVSYGLRSGLSPISEGMPPSPKYPCYTSYNAYPGFCGFINDETRFPIKSIGEYGSIEYWDAYIKFGTNNFKSLCATPDECFYYTIGNDPYFSITKQLESYLEYHMPKCANLTEYASKFGQDVVAGNPKLDVSFKLQSLDVSMTYPINVSFPSYKSVQKYADFKSSKSTRFFLMHRIANMIIEKENSNLSFEPSQQQEFTDLEFPGFRFVHIKNAYMGDSIVRIIDTESFIKGRNEVLQFSIENRNPSLDYIPGRLPVGEKYDIVVMENTTLTIVPKGYDPDNDTIKYYYYGWMADYNISYVNFLGKYMYPNVCDLDKLECSNDINSIMMDDYMIKEEYKSHLSNLEKNAWNNSELFLLTNSSASINLTHNDIGPHNITVFIIDNQGNIDWQLVRILVDDRFKADASNARSLFEEFNTFSEKVASVEDPFILDSSASTDEINPGTVNYLWEDFKEFPSVLANSTQERIIIPLVQNINYINLSPFANSTSVYGKHYNIHILKLTGLQEGVLEPSTDDLQLNVYQCLPHKNDIVKIYPYNGDSDPFMADHTCCNDGGDINNPENPLWGTYFGTDKTCYSDFFLRGGYSEVTASFISENYCGNEEPASCLPKVNLLFGSFSEQDLYNNDIYRYSINRACSGDRGNICGGDLKISKSIFKSISDGESWQTERCKGAQEIGGEWIETYYAPGNSFEKEHALKKVSISGSVVTPQTESADGYCSDRYWCYDGGMIDSDRGNTGTFIAALQCNGGGSCTYTGNIDHKFNCDDLDGRDISEEYRSINALNLELLTDTNYHFEKDVSGKWWTYDYSCDSKEFDGKINSYCKRTKDYDISKYKHQFGQYVSTLAGSEIHNWNENNNIAIIENSITRYDSSGNLEIWENIICGDDSNEYVRRFCKGIGTDRYSCAQIPYLVLDINEEDFDHVIPGHARRTETDDVKLDDLNDYTIGCCSERSDCYYNNKCYKSISGGFAFGNHWNDYFGDSPSSAVESISGFPSLDGNNYFVCKNAHWFSFKRRAIVGGGPGTPH